MTFGEKLKELLKTKEMSRNELSLKTEIYRSSISRYISGKVMKPQDRTIKKIEKAMEVDLKEYYSKSTDVVLINTEGITFGQAVKNALEEKGVTQTQFAKNIGINDNYVSNIINEKSIKKIEMMKKIGMELGIKYEDFKIEAKIERKVELKPFDYSQPIVENFKIALLTIMTDKEISIKQLSKRSGIYDSQIKTYLSGKSMPSLKNAIKMADYLEVSLDELLGYKCEKREYKALSSKETTMGLRLKNLLRETKVKKIELAKLANISARTIEIYEKEKIDNFYIKTIIKIATIFEVSIDDLIGNVTKKEIIK